MNNNFSNIKFQIFF